MPFKWLKNWPQSKRYKESAAQQIFWVCVQGSGPHVGAPPWLDQKRSKFQWIEECQQAFKAVKASMSEAPVSVLPNKTGLFQLQSNTRKTGCDEALFQVQDGMLRLLGYYSRKLLPDSACYGITELEMACMTAVSTAFCHELVLIWSVHGTLSHCVHHACQR